ncbi:MAG: TetR/AcrR family transcriptional regulator [Myxococcota bacterium]
MTESTAGKGKSVSPSSREAWDGDPPHRTAARERLLEVAARCVARDGLNGTGIAHVALEAGVSRPTVYRYFKDRDELIRSVLLQAGLRLANDIRAHMEGFEDPGESAVEAVVYALRSVPANPVLRQVWNPPVFDALVLRGFTQPASIAFTRVAFGDFIDGAGWDEKETTEVMEYMLRIIMSFLASPDPQRSDQELRDLLRRRFLPSLGLPAR